MTTRRAILIINSVKREVLCNPQKDTVADVVRRLGLTGTKVGCGVGQCGACNVILDGKLIRSCVYKMQRVDDYACIETIEGLGTAQNLHPLQQAFLTHAAIQCGFCSPGFIMSAKALLQTNSKPTRQDVRDWFTKHNNICRCTGYKPIVDAVMAAAAVMRGDASHTDLQCTPSQDKQVYGTHFQKPEGISRVLGQCDFGADISEKMPHDTLHLAVVLAKTHKGILKGIDAEKAMEMPGVVRVITAKDVLGTNRIFVLQGSVHSLCHGKDRPILCEDTIHRYGDVLAVVVATSREYARAAAAEVVVNIEALPPVLSYMDAAAKDAPRVHADIPNVYIEQPLYKGDDPRAHMDFAKHVVEANFSTTRQPHLTIEPDVVHAYPQDDGVVIHCKSQFLYGVGFQIAEGIGLEKEKIRIISNPAGSSFGYTMSTATYAMVATCALVLKASVSLVLSYEEHQHMTGKRSPLYANARLACDDEGKLVAMDYLAGLDHGAYSELAGNVTTKVLRFFGVPYAIPHMRGLIRTVFSNNNFGTAFRAFGSPQAYMVSESLVDMLAVQMGMDPFEFRYKNVARLNDLSSTSVPYREYPMQEMMDLLRPHYNKLKEEAYAKNTETLKHGVGVAWGGYHVSKPPDRSEVDIELRPDNGVTLYTTWADVGQGADFGAVAHVHESLSPLQLSLENIRIVSGDTGICPDSGSASGSRSHHAVGLAIFNAAQQLLTAMTKEDGTYYTFEEMQSNNIPTRYRGLYTDNWPEIDPDTGHGYGNVAQNYMLYLTEVAVDINTGKTTVLKTHIGADIGHVGSYHAVLGQAWGGFSHSVGFALSEDYSDMKKHATLRGAGVPQCNDVPDTFHVHFHTTPRENGPHGSTGCAEGFQSSGHVAIINAIYDAIQVRITSLPATPEKILAGLDTKGNQAQEKAWDLGCELYERLEFLQSRQKNK